MRGEGWIYAETLAGHKRRIPLAVVLPPPARGAGTLIPSAQRFVWAHTHTHTHTYVHTILVGFCPNVLNVPSALKT